jgi:hypothetical protein
MNKEPRFKVKTKIWKLKKDVFKSVAERVADERGDEQSLLVFQLKSVLNLLPTARTIS